MPRSSLIFQLPAANARSCTRPAESGTGLVEFAFIFLLLITLMFGIMGFGHALYAYHFVNNEAKEATRWTSVNGSNCSLDSSCNGTGYMNNGPASATDVNTYVQNHVPAGIDPTKVITSACGVAGAAVCAASTPEVCSKAVGALPATPNYPGCTVQVTVSYPFQFAFAPINSIVPAASTTTAPCTKPGICMSSTSDMIIAH
jgi:Flp pilus assembly protein TadG